MNDSVFPRIHVEPLALDSPCGSAALLRLRVSSARAFNWQPGQHLELFVGDDQAGIPYSIASALDVERAGEFELLMSTQGSAELLARVRHGERLTVSPPRGDFVWRALPQGSLFIAMGTGLAPLRAMLQAARRAPSPQPATLLFGARAREDLLFHAEFQGFASTPPGFVFEPTLSLAPAEWEGRRGRVQAHLGAIARQCVGYSAYICGNRQMVRECTALLVDEAGFAPGSIFSEAH